MLLWLVLHCFNILLSLITLVAIALVVIVIIIVALFNIAIL